MGRRTSAQRDQDRADILEALTAAAGPVRTSHLLAGVNGVEHIYAGSLLHGQGLRDLHALKRAGLITTLQEMPGYYELRWVLATDPSVDEDEDLADVRRQRAQWVPA